MLEQLNFYDEMTDLVDGGRVVDIVYLDFSKAFNTVSCKILIDKPMKYGLDEQRVRWIENWLNSQFADDTKLGGVADRPEGHSVIQRDLSRLEKWADRNLTKFNKGKCKVLHLGRNNPRHKYMLGATQLEGNLAKNSLWVLVETKLNMSQQCALVTKKVNATLDFIRQSIARRSKEVILSLSSPLSSPGEATLGVLGPIVESLVQERRGHPGHTGPSSKGP
ncbi:mitochondrial enolase superfamily member 1 [Grus japonensis]|uniref:Mitochondrial enolase superfamily member 1 n=1 Tax=Grus japonensis TaxID=30415 RepID=A0ABC9WA56_GRUJA